jgi:hypothetical protein
MFPGFPRGAGIDKALPAGLTLIAGINGLGKTTLLTAILRALSGPFDLTGEGPPPILGVSIPEAPVPLRAHVLRYFSQRVADEAENAEITLRCTFGSHELCVTRKLSNLYLVDCSVDNRRLDLSGVRASRETAFQNAVAELMGVGSFVDVLLILHHVMLFHENRPGALWDPNAQRQVLRALFLEASDASRLAELERLVQSSDSQARNIQTRITATENDLRDTRQAEEGAEGVLAQLEAEQKLLDADLIEAVRLNSIISELDNERQNVRLDHEKAKVDRQEANGAAERLKYDALLNLYPDMHDTARLVIARILADKKCLVCNADASAKRLEFEKLIAGGFCPICGAPPSDQQNVVPTHRFERAKMRRAQERALLAQLEVDTKEVRLQEIATEYDSALGRLKIVRQAIDDRKARNKRLRANLPNNITSDQLEQALDALRRQLLDWEGRRATHVESLRTLLAQKKQLITSRSAQLMTYFSRMTKRLLAEDARLVQINVQPRYTQAAQPGKPLSVPAFAAEMTAASRPGYVRRITPSDVSESQRELIDLAFRLALVKVATSGKASTFVMETPEASLDGLAMQRVGRALSNFSRESQNRLIVTSNLSNAGIITALFGGKTNSRKELRARRERLLNLLEVAEPNRALNQDSSKYKRLLSSAISGSGH